MLFGLHVNEAELTAIVESWFDCWDAEHERSNAVKGTDA